MRVLHVLSTLDVSSGVANVVMNYYRCIDREKVQFDFLIYRRTHMDFCDEVISLGGRVYEIGRPTLRHFFAYKNKLKNIIREISNEVECVHCHEILFQRWIMPLAKKYGIKKRFLHSHVAYENYGFIKNFRNRILMSNFEKYTNGYFACSFEAARDYFGQDIANKTIVLYNSIDSTRYLFDKEKSIQLKKEIGFQDKIVLGHVGRFVAPKNHLFLLNIFSELVKQNDIYRLLLVGSGEDFDKIVEKSKELGVFDKICFYGATDKVSQMYNPMDIFLFPSVTEGFGNVLLEAQANGLYCIASDRVPMLTNVSGDVKYLSIDNGCAEWLEAILSAPMERKDNIDKIVEKGFDINHNMIVLENQYMNEG